MRTHSNLSKASSRGGGQSGHSSGSDRTPPSQPIDLAGMHVSSSRMMQPPAPSAQQHSSSSNPAAANGSRAPVMGMNFSNSAAPRSQENTPLDYPLPAFVLPGGGGGGHPSNSVGGTTHNNNNSGGTSNRPPFHRASPPYGPHSHQQAFVGQVDLLGPNPPHITVGGVAPPSSSKNAAAAAAAQGQYTSGTNFNNTQLSGVIPPYAPMMVGNQGQTSNAAAPYNRQHKDPNAQPGVSGSPPQQALSSKETGSNKNTNSGSAMPNAGPIRISSVKHNRMTSHRIGGGASNQFQESSSPGENRNENSSGGSKVFGSPSEKTSGSSSGRNSKKSSVPMMPRQRFPSSRASEKKGAQQHQHVSGDEKYFTNNGPMSDADHHGPGEPTPSLSYIPDEEITSANNSGRATTSHLPSTSISAGAILIGSRNGKNEGSGGVQPPPRSLNERKGRPPRDQRNSNANNNGTSGQQEGERQGKPSGSSDVPLQSTLSAVDIERHRVQQREKQINFGKVTPGYRIYRYNVPRHARQTENSMHPMTPDPNQQCSKRRWDAIVAEWRRALHRWDSCPSAESVRIPSKPTLGELGLAPILSSEASLEEAAEDISRANDSVKSIWGSGTSTSSQTVEDLYTEDDEASAVAAQSMLTTTTATATTATTAPTITAATNSGNTFELEERKESFGEVGADANTSGASAQAEENIVVGVAAVPGPANRRQLKKTTGSGRPTAGTAMPALNQADLEATAAAEVKETTTGEVPAKTSNNNNSAVQSFTFHVVQLHSALNGNFTSTPWIFRIKNDFDCIEGELNQMFDTTKLYFHENSTASHGSFLGGTNATISPDKQQHGHQNPHGTSSKATRNNNNNSNTPTEHPHHGGASSSPPLPRKVFLDHSVGLETFIRSAPHFPQLFYQCDEIREYAREKVVHEEDDVSRELNLTPGRLMFAEFEQTVRELAFSANIDLCTTPYSSHATRNPAMTTPGQFYASSDSPIAPSSTTHGAVSAVPGQTTEYSPIGFRDPSPFMKDK